MLINYKHFMLVAQLDSSVDNVYEQYKNKFNFFFCLNQILPHTCHFFCDRDFNFQLISVSYLSLSTSLSLCVCLSLGLVRVQCRLQRGAAVDLLKYHLNNNFLLFGIMHDHFLLLLPLLPFGGPCYLETRKKSGDVWCLPPVWNLSDLISLSCLLSCFSA